MRPVDERERFLRGLCGFALLCADIEKIGNYPGARGGGTLRVKVRIRGYRMVIRADKVLRWVRLLGLAAAVALAIGAAMIGFVWLRGIPWWVWRGAKFGFLYALRIGYATVLVAAPLGVLLLGVQLIRARRRGVASPVVAHLLLLCTSLCAGLIVCETAATAWWVNAHRRPSLPQAFAAEPILPTRFGQGTDGRDVRILVLGESSAFGIPYSDYTSVGRIVAWQLEREIPGRRFHVDMLANSGDHLEHQHQKLSQITHRPDAMILYSGHNEFYSRFPTTREALPYTDQIKRQRRHALARLARRVSVVYRLIQETIDQHTLALRPPRRLRRSLVDVPAYTPAEYAERLADFRARLEAIVAYCDTIGCLPILVIPPANDGDEPNRSILPPRTPRAQREAFARDFETARQAEANDHHHALALYRALLARQPGFAETHFRIARLLERAGSWNEAYQHYVRARDLDAHPQRCPSDFQNVYREVAARHPNALLVDGQAVCRVTGPHGLLNDYLFGDGMHPSLRGYIALASAITSQLYERRALGWSAGAEAPTIDPIECCEHFGVDAPCWISAAEFGSLYYHMLSGLRHDPTERQAKGKRYDKARRRLALGYDPEEAGVPSVGVLPAPASDQVPPDNVDSLSTPPREQSPSPLRPSCPTGIRGTNDTGIRGINHLAIPRQPVPGSEG